MSATDPNGTRPATAEEAGRNCPYCRFAVKQGSSVTPCPACHAIHHEECWGDNDGCAIVGCSAAPAQAPSRAPVTAPAPAPPAIAPPAFAAASPPPPPAPPHAGPSHGRRITPLLTVVLVGALAAAGAATAVVATRKDDDKTPVPTVPLAITTTDATTDATTPAPTPSSTPSPAAQKRAIITILRDYEAAYSGHDIAGLRAIMEPAVTRHGLREGGCSDTSGRAAVLQTYAEQFATGTGNYTLHGLTTGAVDLTEALASVPLTYSISGGGSGSVRFDLRETAASGWQISHVDASC
jgi:hypothetical protein